MTPIKARNYINGEWRDGASEFESLNPANQRETIGTAPLSTAKDVDDAVAAAKRHEPELVVIGEHLITGSPIEAARRIARISDAVMLLVARPGFPEKQLPTEASLNGPFALEQIDSAVSAAKSLHHPAMERRQPLFAA